MLTSDSAQSSTAVCGDAKILIVDDSATNTLLLSKILNFTGYANTRTLNHSDAFVQVFSEYHPDLILLDIMMPHVDGFEILEWLGKNITTTKPAVIVVTALNDHAIQHRAYSLGARDFIGKPFSKAEITARVSNLLQIDTLYRELIESTQLLEKRIQEKTQAVENIQIEIIDRFMHAVEFRDEETKKRTERISQYVYNIARGLELSDPESKLIATASKMHDLGEVGTSDTILLKPGKLNDTERKEMESHTAYGASMLTNSQYDLIRIAEQIARTHHEKWDGSGYPNGLLQEDIPLVGRIVAVADVFDALISARPYKPAWSFDDAVQYLSAQSGIQFDPKVVRAFLDSIGKIRLIS